MNKIGEIRTEKKIRNIRKIKKRRNKLTKKNGGKRRKQRRNQIFFFFKFNDHKNTYFYLKKKFT